LATSSCDSETYAAAAAAKEAIHLRRLLAMPNEPAPPGVLLGDNKSSIKAPANGTDKGRSKHIGVSAHFLRGVVAGRSASSTSTCRVPKASLMHSVKIDISPLSTSFNSNAHNYESATYQFSTQLFWISDISPGLVIFSL
jgi:hypothetical protein